MSYTQEEKIELSNTFATVFHRALMRDLPNIFMSDIARELFLELKKLDWFGYAGDDKKLLRHLEEAEVFGVYNFYPDKRPTLYLEAVFSVKFVRWSRERRPPLEKFLAAFPKSEAKKPDPEDMIGKIDFDGGIHTKTAKERRRKKP